ncbi:unnamed protein product [Closterium sp. NIES-54]
MCRPATCCPAVPRSLLPRRAATNRAAPPCRAAPLSRAVPPSRAAPLYRAALPSFLHFCCCSAATTTTAATASTAAMASPNVLTFDAEGREVDFDVWVDDLLLFLRCDSRDGVSLFDHTSSVSTAPAATAESTVCWQWTTRDAVARLAVRSHLPPAERAHFGQYKTATSLYDAVVARYSSPATAALSRLMLPYLFPDLAAFATVADLIAHLRTSDARYRDALPTEICAQNPPPMYITLYYLVTRLPDSTSSVLLAATVAPLSLRGVPLSPFSPLLLLLLLSTSLALRRSELRLPLMGGAATARARGARVVEGTPGAAEEVVEEAEGVAVEVGVVPGVGASLAAVELVEAAAAVVEAVAAVVEAAAAVVEVAAAVVMVEVQPRSVEALVVASASSRRVPVRPHRPSSFVSGTLGVGGLRVLVPALTFFASAVILPRWHDLLRQNVAIIDLDFDAILAAMNALTDSAEGDCYLSVPPDPGIEVLIDWICSTRCQLGEHFGSDLPVLRLHSDRGGEFSSDLLRAFCRVEGIRETFMLLASPQQNGIAERRIRMVMDDARTSMIHAAAPHFLWPFAVQYATHQINLQPRVSLPKTTPTLRWTGKVGDASAFRGPAPLGVSQVDPAEPIKVAVDSGAARGAGPAGVGTRGAEPGGSPGVPLRLGPLSSQRLREWYAQRCGRAIGAARDAAGAGSTGGATSAGAAGGAASAGAVGGATGAGAAGGAARTRGTGAAGARGAAGVVTRDPRAEGTGAISAVYGGAKRPRPYCVPLLQQVLGPTPPLLSPPPVQSQSQIQPASPLPGPSPYSGPTERRERESRLVSSVSRPASPESRFESLVRTVRAGRRVSRPCPPLVPGTHFMTLRPSKTPQRVPLPSLPASSLPDGPDPESDSLRAASPTSTAASALVAELVDFAAACRLDFATSLVSESASASVCPPSVGDPDAPDIPTPRSYAEVIEGPYSSQWQAAMDAEMASWKSTCTYVDEVPPPGANIVSGMWIFRVKRAPGSLPVCKARYVARGFSQRQGVDFFHTFSPTPTSYLGLQITRDRAQRTITLTESHMVQQDLQSFDFMFSSPQSTPLPTGHLLSAPPSDESVEPSSPYPELVGCLMYLMTCT